MSEALVPVAAVDRPEIARPQGPANERDQARATSRPPDRATTDGGGLTWAR